MDLGKFAKANSESLFTKGPLQAVIDQQLLKLRNEVEAIPSDRFLNTSPIDLVNYLTEKYSLDAITLHEEQGSVDHKEVVIDVSDNPMRRFVHDHQGGSLWVNATRVELHIPFSGDGSMFSYQPDCYQSGGAFGAVKNGNLILTQDVEIMDPDAVNRSFDQTLQFVRVMVGYSSNMIARCNAQLPEKAKGIVDARRNRLLNANNMVSGLKFPMRKRPGEPGTYVIPSVRKRVIPVLPSAPSSAYTSDPTIDMAIYEDILRTLRSMSLMMERSPSAFQSMDEEAIRNLFLVSLNASFEGEATGETFNGKGKTDILIRHQNQNLFIGECKVWRGAKEFSKGVDQLMGYVTWRDTKAALLVFNRGQNTSKVFATIREVILAHSQYKRMETPAAPENLRVVLGQVSDPNREVIVEVLLFDVPDA